MIRDFEYLAPATVKEALAFLDKYSDNCKVICGGQSLLVLMKQGLVAPEYLISIKNLTELDYIKSDKGGLKIGATTSHREIEHSKVIQKAFPVLSKMELKLASPQTRSWGTIGGNLAHGDPAGDPAPVLIALKASVVVTSSKGSRTIPLEEFYVDFFETVMKEEEIITEIQIPAPALKTGVAYKKFNIIQSDMATVGVAASVTLKADGTCADARFVLGASAPVPMRAKKAEQIIVGKKITNSLLVKAGEVASTEADPLSDIHASADYRRELIKVMVKRMGAEALAQASK
jgi:carbon-monoxide dehydrogenase medium subunit